MGFLMMLSGRHIDPLNLKPEDIQPEDIAQGLSTAARFNGQTHYPYSVAEHSVYVARVVDLWTAGSWGNSLINLKTMQPTNPAPYSRKTLIRQALLHDAPEYILPDLSYPIKITPQFSFYREMDDAIWAVTAKRFNVPVEIHPIVKMIDKRIASNEKLILQGPDMPPHWVDYMAKYPPLPADLDVIDRYPVAPAQARRRFLDFYQNVRED